MRTLGSSLGAGIAQSARPVWAGADDAAALGGPGCVHRAHEDTITRNAGKQASKNE